MHLNMGHKIFGIALTVLLLMVTVAFFSIKMTAKISSELNSLAFTEMPLSETIGEINVKILEQGMILQQSFAMDEMDDAFGDRVSKLSKELDQDFKIAYELFIKEENIHTSNNVLALHHALKKVEKEYLDYRNTGLELLTLKSSLNHQQFEERLPDFNRLQNAIDQEVSLLRVEIEENTLAAVQRANENELTLLVFNIVMTILSAMLGLGFATFVTIALVRNIKELVRVTNDVEAGYLDVEASVVTKDEIGKLSSSFNSMTEGLRMKERIKETFGKYMDPRIVSKLINNPELTSLGGERHEMTVLFVDLQGYTTISEKLAPTDLVKMLNLFLGHITSSVSEYNGVINDFQGDAVLAFWGPPFVSKDDHAVLACQAALKAMDNFKMFEKEAMEIFGDDGKDIILNMRIGISTGDVISGNIGSEASRKFSVIGDPVNLGARLEGANKAYGTNILIAERTFELAAQKINARELDLLQVKGKNKPTRIFELLNDLNDRSNLVDALTSYRNKNWDDAQTKFQEILDRDKNDTVSKEFLDRIETFKKAPPPANWQGVWELTTK